MCGCFAYWNAIWVWRQRRHQKLMIDDPYDMHCYYNPVRAQEKRKARLDFT